MVEAIPKTNTITMNNTETKVLTVSGLMTGIYRFKLTATSDSGLKEVATATITVFPGMKNIILIFREQDYKKISNFYISLTVQHYNITILSNTVQSYCRKSIVNGMSLKIGLDVM